MMLYLLLATILAMARGEFIYVADVGTYPGYAGEAKISGSASLEFQGAGVRISYKLTGVEEKCSLPDTGVSNSCGIHIHEGTSCDNSTLPGGHYFNKGTISADPWATASYRTTFNQDAYGEVEVDFGYGFDTTKGRTLVIHDRSGARVTCALLLPRTSGAPASARSTVFIKDLGRYPGYAGVANITGSANLMFHDDNSVRIEFSMRGVERSCYVPDQGVANSCGIHIHEGISCEDAAAPGGHYFNKDTISSDPWATAVYHSFFNAASGHVEVTFGFDAKQTTGRALVVHDFKGARVTCALIPTNFIGTAGPSVYVYVPDVGKYPGYTGKVAITGTSILGFAETGVEINYSLFGVEPACSTPNATAPNSCGIHIHEGKSCDDISLPGGHYYNKDVISSDPWIAASYRAAGTTATGSVSVEFGFGYDTTIGRVLVVHDRSGARVTCAVLKAASEPALPSLH